MILAVTVLLWASSAAVAADSGYIELEDGLTLAEQFGYVPDYSQHVVTFAPDGSPTIRSRSASQDRTSFVHRLEGGQWVKHDLLAALRSAYPRLAGTVHAGGLASDRVDWDIRGRAYTVLTIRLKHSGVLRSVLMASADGLRSWQVLELPFSRYRPRAVPHDRGNVIAEHSSGSRPLEGPPLIGVYGRIGPWKGQWASLNQLRVMKPVWRGTKLKLPTPVVASGKALPLLQAAGGSSFAVTHGHTSFFVYATVAALRAKTTPTYVAVYDSRTRCVKKRKLIARSRPSNDSHCSPGICMDSTGILHVATGAHGWPFWYTRSTQPHSAVSWTKPTQVIENGFVTDPEGSSPRVRQTYLSMACGPDDVIHIVCRQGRSGDDEHLDGLFHNALVHTSLAPAQRSWEVPDLIVVPPQPGYSNYYQKLTVDQLGRLFVSCSYFSRRDPPATRRARRFHHRMILMSDDGGATWRFATNDDFMVGLSPGTDPPETEASGTQAPVPADASGAWAD